MDSKLILFLFWTQNRCGEGGRREVLCHPVRKLKQPLEKATEPAGGRMEGAVCGRELLCQSSQKLKHAFEEEAVPGRGRVEGPPRSSVDDIILPVPGRGRVEGPPRSSVDDVILPVPGRGRVEGPPGSSVDNVVLPVPGRSRVEGPPGFSVGNVILPVPGQKSPSPNVPTTLCKPLTALRPPLSCLPCGGNCVFDKVKFEVLDEESPQEVFRELPKEAPAHYHQAGISCPVLQQASHGVQIKALMAGQPTVQNDNLIASTPKVTQVHAASLNPSRIEASHASVVRNGMVGIEAPLDVATTDLKPTMVGKLAPIHDACKGKFPIDKFKIERLAEYPLQKVATAPFKGVTALMQVAVTPQDKGDSSHKRIFAPSQEVAKEENSNKLNSDSKRKLLNPSETVVVLKKPKLESVVMNELVVRPNRKTLCNVFQISRVLPEALQAGKRPADWPSMSVPLYVCLRPPSPTMHMKTGAQAQPLQASFARNLQHFAVPKTEPSLEEVSGPPLVCVSTLCQDQCFVEPAK